MEIKFNKQDHSYKIEGQSVKSVTQLLQEYNLVPKFFNQKAALRGTYVHKAIELYLQDNLDEESLDSIIKPYFQGFKKWYLRAEPEIREIEYRVGSLALGFAGTLDFIGLIKEELFVVDWKTSQEIYPSHWLQLEMYRRLVGKEGWAEGANIAILHLPEGKLIRPAAEEESRAIEIVRAIIKIENFKRRKK